MIRTVSVLAFLLGGTLGWEQGAPHFVLILCCEICSGHKRLSSTLLLNVYNVLSFPEMFPKSGVVSHTVIPVFGGLAREPP